MFQKLHTPVTDCFHNSKYRSWMKVQRACWHKNNTSKTVNTVPQKIIATADMYSMAVDPLKTMGQKMNWWPKMSLWNNRVKVQVSSEKIDPLTTTPSVCGETESYYDGAPCAKQLDKHCKDFKRSATSQTSCLNNLIAHLNTPVRRAMEHLYTGLILEQKAKSKSFGRDFKGVGRGLCVCSKVLCLVNL